MRFGLAAWLIGFVPLAGWRKAETLTLTVFAGGPKDSAIPPIAFSMSVRMCGCGNFGKSEECWSCGESAHPHIRTLGVKSPKMIDSL